MQHPTTSPKKARDRFIVNHLISVSLSMLLILYLSLVIIQQTETINTTPLIISSAVLLAIAISICYSLTFSLSITQKVNEINERLSLLAEGRIPGKIKITNSDKHISGVALNNLIDQIKTASDVAERIGRGELDIMYDQQQDNNILLRSLKSMHEKLSSSAMESNRRNWITTGLANFGDIVRTGNSNLNELCQRVLSNLIKYIKASQGQLFIIKNENGEEYLELTATYAWDKIKYDDKKIQKGDGLAGQAWIEASTIYLKEVPGDYMKITSGLGQALPGHLLIVPLRLSEEVFGLVEIASFNKMEAHEIEFVEKLGEMLASTFSSLQVSERTKGLLEQSQQHAEELRAQEEEMRQSMEELTAIQEEMARKDMEMSGQLMAINNSMASIEFSMDGYVITANERFLRFTGYALDEIRGKHHRFFIDEEYASSVDYADFWKKLKNGLAQSGEFKRRVKNHKTVWISASYTVVTDKYGAPCKVIKFALDITAQKLKALDFEGQINAVNRTMAVIEFDTQGNVLSANDAFLNTMDYASNQVVGAHHRIFMDAKEVENDEYKKFWSDLKKGVAKTGEFKRFARNGNPVWINASYTPIKDTEGVVYKVVKFAQDITKEKLKAVEFEGQASAIDRTMAAIEFDLNGKILNANENFLQITGYLKDQVVGNHHSIFVHPLEKESGEYREFWYNLRAGIPQVGEFRRFGKSGKTIWISASYTPIKDASGKVSKVIKFAQDITRDKIRSVDFEGQIHAVNNTMAAIEFNLQGEIVHANSNFLTTMGYSLSEITGKHHRMFVEPALADSQEYRMFWNDLRNGKARTGEFKRYGKNQKEVWINASYTPIKDLEGNVYKIMKFAQDVTEEKLDAVNFAGQINAIRKSNAVIEFDMEGKILFANDIFLEAMGYKNADEVLNKHHSIFVPDFEVQSREYKKFWERLESGEFFSGEFKRKKANGESIWIYGSYNPILSLEGRPYKVVKYAQIVRKSEQEISHESLVTS
ncbi:PAS domain-containing protein [Chryseosolibacter indicus]|uniref:PAS domain S-box protein n=1 Tax=Chryseosolibacter indicus TaxID=2782351 RepID=A0ABS5VSP6_9BACT|nr:PAS domain-containing protein [Chryseosolibacter indicus]MBT1704432.1 PAS domain S-box protein [Chryseosolibacter indicus]